MQQQTRLSLNAAAWFFVGQAHEDGAQNNVPIVTPFNIGRNPNSDLCLPCSSVSSSHAEIIEENGELWLHDLDSTNGTFINGARIRLKTRLSENDTVQFGTTVFQVAREEKAERRNTNSRSGHEAKPVGDQSESIQRLLNGGVVPFFQPVLRIGVSDQSVVGYEVLGRSRLFGLRTPAQMFAVASRLEMEAELSRVLRKQGIKIADTNLPESHLLFVNTHPAELKCEGLEESLFQIRDDHPYRPIMLEVHESVLNDSEKFMEIRSALRSLDIQLACHEFGAGPIHLGTLSEISPDVVKFDVKLVQGIDKATSKRQQFVASMVKMVTELGITPMAECIEQTGEHETLLQLGFQLGQGFLYGRPSPITECSETASRIKIKSEQIPQVKSFLEEPAKKQSALPTNESSVAGDPRNAEWLLSQPENHYTIQVLSAISLDRANEHVAMQKNPEQFAIFCKQGKTRMLYIVVYGVFEDRAAAKAASDKLANASVSPWIRMLSSVHAEIKS